MRLEGEVSSAAAAAVADAAAASSGEEAASDAFLLLMFCLACRNSSRLVAHHIPLASTVQKLWTFACTGRPAAALAEQTWYRDISVPVKLSGHFMLRADQTKAGITAPVLRM